MRNSQILIVALILAGCSMLPNTTSNDKRYWEKVECNGLAGWESCYRKANRLCPNGFDTANKLETITTRVRSFEVACKIQPEPAAKQP